MPDAHARLRDLNVWCHRQWGEAESEIGMQSVIDNSAISVRLESIFNAIQ